MKKTVLAGAIIIFATSAGLLAGAANSRAAPTPSAGKSAGPPPALYDVPDDARDPFSWPGASWSPAGKRSPGLTAQVTAKDVRAALHVQLVSKNAAGEAVALVNGVLIQVGGKLPLTVRGEKLGLLCTRIDTSPPAVIFKWKNVLLSAGKTPAQHKGEGQ